MAMKTCGNTPLGEFRKIRQLLADGRSRADVAKALAMSAATVCRRMKLHGLIPEVIEAVEAADADAKALETFAAQPAEVQRRMVEGIAANVAGGTRITPAVAEGLVSRAQSVAECAGDDRIRELLRGTSWGGAKEPKSSTERSRAHRAKGREIGEIPPVADPRRRDAAAQSLLRFGMTYCCAPGKMLKRKPSKRMMGFVDALEETIRHGGNRHVRWPRGKGKSSWLKVAAIWSLVNGFRRFVLFVSATRPMAEIVTAEIWQFCTEDPLFAADYPEFAVPLADVGLTPQRSRLQTYRGVRTHICDNARFSYKRFATLDGYAHTGGIIAARGADQAIRGLNIGSRRPDFVFIDDPQTDDDAASSSRVDKIEARIQGAIQGLGETGETLAAVMATTPIEPGDVSERFADQDRHGEWLTTTEGLVAKFGPKEWISRYLEELRRDNAAHDVLLTKSRAWYVAHRAEIEDGVEMMDDGDFDPSMEVSAYQHALNRLHVMKARAFYAECQMRPANAEGVFRLSADKVAAHVNGCGFGIVPEQCDHGIVAFCDVNDVVGLRWEIMAFGAGRVTATLAYGRYPREGRLYPDGTPIAAIPNYLAPAMREVAAAIRATRFRTAQGEAAKVSAICFDGGWQTDTVAVVCAEIDGVDGVHAVWSKGYDSRHYSRNLHEKAKSTEGCRAAEECHTWITANGRYMAFNSDYWREVSQTSFLAPPLSPSSSSFWGDDPLIHYEFATEVAAEELVSKVSDIRYGDIWKWKVKGANHYGDTHAGCMAFGAIRGDFDPIGKVAAADVMAAAKARKRVRYVFKGW